jgi:hypothetical protein
VQALTRPSVSAWTVNQLARRHVDEVRELLDASAALVEGQRTALAGKGTEDYEEATARRREALRALTKPAEAILREAGRPASDATMRKIADTLRAASADEVAAELLRRGRLSEDVESSGLFLAGGLEGALPAKAKRAAAPKKQPADDRREQLKRARALVDEARKEEREARKAAAEAERDAEQARAAADETERRAADAREEAERAAEALREAEEEVRRLRGR